MTPTPKHTQTPWKATRLQKQALYGCYDNVISRAGFDPDGENQGGQGEVIATLETDGEDTRANAKFIVMACNNHDKLVEALRKIEDLPNTAFASGDAIIDACGIARAVLAAVEGE